MSNFLTRPRFQDRDIRQLSGDTITLSGDTIISGSIGLLPGAVTGYVIKAIDSNGTFGWQPVSVSADTNTYVTGGTLSGNDLILNWNTGGSASPIDMSGLLFTGNTSGNCITDLYVSNIHSCSPLNINPLDEGNVYFGSTNGVTIDLMNNRLGVNTNNPTERFHVEGGDLLVKNTNGKFYTNIQNVTGPATLLSGNTNGVSRIGVVVPTYDSVTFGVRGPSAGFAGYGKQGDSFIYSSNGNNGFNIISQPGTGTDDYVRFFVGQAAGAAGTPDLYIQGSGSTRGYVGINTGTPTELLHVNGNTKISGTLNIGTIGANSPIINLGLDSGGNVVTGTTGSGAFTGNTSGDCITDLWVTNIHGCSPITLWDSLQSIGSSATGTTSFALGVNNLSTNIASFAEGGNNISSGQASHAEGAYNIASGDASHAEGTNTEATGLGSHAQGQWTKAKGDYSHAGGYGADSGSTITAGGNRSFIHFSSKPGSGLFGTYSNDSAILGGTNHNIGINSNASVIIGGDGNYILDNSLYSGVFCGIGNTISDSSTYATILGGYYNAVGKSDYNSVIMGGEQNSIGNGSPNCGIIAGGFNSINGLIKNSVVLGGTGITVTQSDTVYVPDLVIKRVSIPTSSGDTVGDIGSISWDDNYFYTKTNNGWGRIPLDYGF